MNCSIISIGTELNLGLILNRNSKYIAERIADLGLECRFMFTVSDKTDDISEVLKQSLNGSALVIISGGLGPTDDDITREAVASVLDLKLVRDRSLDHSSLKFIKKTKNKEICKRLLRQSYIPENSFSIKARVGSASGFRIQLDDGKIIFCLPGVPKELRSMFDCDVMPFLKSMIKKKHIDTGRLKLRKTTLLTTDISETEIEEKIKNIVSRAAKIGVKIGITADPGLIKIIIVARSADGREADKKIKIVEDEICSRLGNYFYGKNNTLISDNLKEAIAKLGDNPTVCTAESITGGLISSIITDTPGSSKFFLGGIVSYSDYSKIKLLDIDEDTLKRQGAVSRVVCINMARRAKEIFKSDYAVSVTGFAGPEAEDRKLGLVYCCILGPDDYEKIFKKRFVGSRQEIKFRTTQFVLNKLRAAISIRKPKRQTGLNEGR
jgi:nicotinamide-nucleotide amidase